MQRAAAGLAYAVIDLLGSAYGRRVLLLVGSGDNGGDALYAGALLARRGVQVEAWLLSDHAHEAGTPRCGRRWPGRRSPAYASERTTRPGGRRDRRDRRPARAAARGARRRSRRSTGCRSSRSTPRAGSTSTPASSTARTSTAALTVTFGTHKVAHLVDPAARACGAVHLVDIGLDLPGRRRVEALQPDDVAALLPRPAPDAQKYTRGVVGVRAGSTQYPGAALLSVAGAATGLCGMVRYVGPAPVADRVREAHPEVVGAGRVQAWVVGSGGGEHAGDELAAALADGVPVVVDADALAHVDGPLPVPAILTPHAGELAAMLDADRADIEARPLAHATPRGRDVRLRGAAQGPPHPGRHPRRPGPGDHHRHALAGHRRRRRRARRTDRRAARRRPHAVRRRVGRLVAARRRRDPRLAAAGRSSRARSRRPSRRPSGACPTGDGTIGGHEPPCRSRAEIVVDLAAIRHNVRTLRAADRGRVDDGRQGRRLRPRHGRGRPGRSRGRRGRGSASPPSTRRSRCGPPATPAGCCAG